MTTLGLGITRGDLAARVMAALCSTPFVCACGETVTGDGDKDQLQCASCGWEETTSIQLSIRAHVTVVQVKDDGGPLNLITGDSVQFTTRDGRGKFFYHAE